MKTNHTIVVEPPAAAQTPAWGFVEEILAASEARREAELRPLRVAAAKKVAAVLEHQGLTPGDPVTPVNGTSSPEKEPARQRFKELHDLFSTLKISELSSTQLRNLERYLGTIKIAEKTLDADSIANLATKIARNWIFMDKIEWIKWFQPAPKDRDVATVVPFASPVLACLGEERTLSHIPELARGIFVAITGIDPDASK